MKSSFTNRSYNFVTRNYSNILNYFVTKYVYLKCLIQDVKLGSGCFFIGNIKFKVGNGGSIEIGNKCKFISSKTANSIGINHRCILSATPAICDNCILKIGNNCGFSGTSIWCFESIIIGDNVRCGANTLIIDGDAHFDDPRTSPPKPIIIKDNVFIGANVIVKKGVTIGENTVVGMNSVVTKDLPPNSIAVGNPCKVIRQL